MACSLFASFIPYTLLTYGYAKFATARMCACVRVSHSALAIAATSLKSVVLADAIYRVDFWLQQSFKVLVHALP